MKLRTVLTALLPASVLALGAAAQEAGGLRLTLGLSERVEATRNLALAPVSAGTTVRADTELSFGLTSDTRNQSFSLSGSAALRAARDAGGGGTDFSLADPSFGLAYSRRGAGSEFSLNARLTTDDVAYLRPLSDFEENGEIILPDDLSALQGDGTRSSYRASAALRFGQDGPLGMGVSAGISGVAYSDTTAALFDHHESWAEVSGRLSPAAGRRVTASLRYALFESDDPTVSDRETVRFDSRVEFDRANGMVYGRFGAVHVPAGTRLSLGGGLRRDLPAGVLELELGGTRTTADNIAVTGSASLTQQYAFGVLEADIQRSVASDSANDERVVTAAGLTFSREITPLTNISFGMDYARSASTGASATVTNAVISATLERRLNRDWSADLGYRRSYRKDDSSGTGWASSDTVFFGISRSFGTRF